MRRNPRTRRIGESVSDYQSADRFLGGKEEKKLAHNTKIYRGGEGSIGVVLHRTTIVRYRADGTIELDSGRYRTKTTAQRINQLLPPGYGLYQKRYDWFVRTPQGDIDFEDGMVLSTDRDVRESREQENPGGTGKFSDIVEGTLYMMDSDESLAIPDGGGWYGLFLGVTKADIIEAIHDNGDDASGEEIDAWTYPIHAIMHEDSQGFMDTETFASAKAAEEAWGELEAEFGYGDEGED